MSSVPNPGSRSLARADESMASTRWIPQAFVKAAMGIALLAGGGADARAAKPTFGLQVGIGTDMPNPRLEVEDGCGFDGADTHGAPADDCRSWAPGVAGRVRVPVHLRLSDHASFVLLPGVEGGTVTSQVTWDRKNQPACDFAGSGNSGLCPLDGAFSEYTYSGHFGFMVVPTLGAGVRAHGDLTESIGLIGGVNLSVGYVWMLQSVGATGAESDGPHGMTYEAFANRETSGSDAHCTGKNPKCPYDLVLADFKPGAEVSVGVLLKREGRPVSLELSYGVNGALSGQPRHYKPAVRVKYMMWNPVMLTVGTTFGG